MGIATFSIDKAPVITVTPAGGVGTEDSVFKAVSNSQTQTTLVCTNDPDFKTRRSFDLTIKPAKPLAGAPNGYSQVRTNLFYRQPLVLDNGNITVNTLRVELSHDVELSNAERIRMLMAPTQVFVHGSWYDVWHEQVIS